MRLIAGIRCHHAELGGWIGGRGEGDDPSHVHGEAQPENALVERLRSRRVGGVEIGNYSTNAHGRITSVRFGQDACLSPKPTSSCRARETAIAVPCGP